MELHRGRRVRTAVRCPAEKAGYHINVKKTNGDIIIADVRERALKELLEKYDAIRTPIFLKTLLEKLVDGSGNTVETNFKTHRDFLGDFKWRSLPMKARMIQGLIAKYPG
jgi:hypothetical protein